MFVRLPRDGDPAAKLQRSSVRARAGFTLFELLLVLAVVVAIGSLTWPRMLRFIEENALKQNVELVRRELSNTRILAIESGLTYQFRFEPTAQAFVILPYDRPETVVSEQSASQTTLKADTSARKVKTVSGQISSDCLFKPATDNSGKQTGVARLDDMWLALVKNGAAYSQTSWSPPILFRPNGESQDARLVIRDKAGNTIELTVRGRTLRKPHPIAESNTMPSKKPTIGAVKIP